MPIGGADRAERLDQARSLARIQVFAGHRTHDVIVADVLAAVAEEVPDPDDARRTAEDYVDEAVRDREAAAAGWPVPTDYDRLQAALSELEGSGFIVVQSCDDHWDVETALRELRAAGHEPRAAAFYTETDAWHAVAHQMLELNVWHGSSANLMTGEDLLDETVGVLARHGLPATFDEGRLELTMQWQRRP
jgi:hypothetical protein